MKLMRDKMNVLSLITEFPKILKYAQKTEDLILNSLYITSTT